MAPGGKCRKGTESAKKESDRDPVAGLRKQVTEGQAARDKADKARYVAEAKKEVKSIVDEINLRGPHTMKERENLQRMLKQAQTRLERIETGKTMTREEFQAGLKKMSGGEERKKEIKDLASRIKRQESSLARMSPGKYTAREIEIEKKELQELKSKMAGMVSTTRRTRKPKEKTPDEKWEEERMKTWNSLKGKKKEELMSILN